MPSPAFIWKQRPRFHARVFAHRVVASPAASSVRTSRRSAGVSWSRLDCSREIVGRLPATIVRAAFHLPLQHASSRLLTAMRRPYRSGTRARRWNPIANARRVHRMRHHRRLPGRTRRDCGTCVSRMPLTHLHVFPCRIGQARLRHRYRKSLAAHCVQAARSSRHRASLDERFRRVNSNHRRALTSETGRSRYRQLPEGANPPRLRPQRMGERQDHRVRRPDGGGQAVAITSGV